MNTVICRTCLSKRNPEQCKPLAPVETYNNVFLLNMVKFCIPELRLNTHTHPAICLECIQNLSDFYKFKQMCLENDSKYSALTKAECFDLSNKTCKLVPSTESDKNNPSSPNTVLSKKGRNVKTYKPTVERTDVNQNELSENAKVSKSNNMKRKRFTFYRTRFMNSSCIGCKNRILDVKYHSKVFLGYYDCFNCGKRFKSIADMRKHIYTHTLPYVCNLCGKKWRGQYALDVHLRSHTKQKPFECPVCNKKFVQSYSLHQHLGIHQEDTNKNRCPVCDKVLSTKYNLKIHMTAHNSGSKPTCPKCNKWFYTEAAVMKHSESCCLGIVKEENEITCDEPEFIKTEEVPDSVKEEADDDIFVEEPSVRTVKVEGFVEDTRVLV